MSEPTDVERAMCFNWLAEAFNVDAPLAAVCFTFFWETVTPVISCAKPVILKIRCLPATEAMVRETLVLPDSALNASSVTSSKPSSLEVNVHSILPF